MDGVQAHGMWCILFSMIFMAWLCCLMLPRDIQVVVARYAEDLAWLTDPPFDTLKNVIVYDKNDGGDASHGNPPPYARVERLPNVGREGHTYLHHIVTHWDTLADVTVFVMGSCRDTRQKWIKAAWVARRVQDTGDSAIPDTALARPLHEALGDFSIESYGSSDATNARLNPETYLLPCPHRPLGVWLRANGMPPVHGVTARAMFAVSRRHIQQRPRAFYEGLLRYLDHHSNPEAGQFLERAWLAVFHPIPLACRSSTYVNKVSRVKHG